MSPESFIKFIKGTGYLASTATLALWVILLWLNPYFQGMNQVSLWISLTMLAIPAVLFGIGLFRLQSVLMLISFVWSFPYSMYMLLTPGIFLGFGITNLIFLLCYVLLRIHKRS